MLNFNVTSNWHYLVIVVLLALVLSATTAGIGGYFLDRRLAMLLIFVLGALSVSFTATGETYIAATKSAQTVLIFIFASTVLYSILLYINNATPSGVPVFPNSLIALSWNIANTFAVTMIGFIIDPRLAALPLKGKLAIGLIVLSVIVAGFSAKYVDGLLVQTAD